MHRRLWAARLTRSRAICTARPTTSWRRSCRSVGSAVSFRHRSASASVGCAPHGRACQAAASQAHTLRRSLGMSVGSDTLFGSYCRTSTLIRMISTLALHQNCDDNRFDMHATPTLTITLTDDAICLHNNEVSASLPSPPLPSPSLPFPSRPSPPLPFPSLPGLSDPAVASTVCPPRPVHQCVLTH
jgi:hypothetical protein